MPQPDSPIIIESHLLQNFSPSCLNRDDTNTPKSCVFGGTRRARVSSQCLKRATRLHMRDHYGVPTGTRTRRLAEVIAKRLADSAHGEPRDESQALALARLALQQAGFKLTTGSDEGRIQVGLYLADEEINQLAEAVRNDWDALLTGQAAAEAHAAAEAQARAEAEAADASGGAPQPQRGRTRGRGRTKPLELNLSNVSAAIKGLSDSVDACDIALFGRMVAENPHMKVDAASQVAHALSTHTCELEMDYFTAVDDEQEDEDPGAGMLGLVGFQSACFYRYSLIHRDQLVSNLKGNDKLANETIVAFVRSTIEAIPTGRQKGSAAHNWPDHVAVRVGGRLPMNLANAFASPVRGSSSTPLVESSAKALEGYRGRLEEIYGADGEWFVCSTVTEGNGSLTELDEWLRLQLPEA